MLRKRWWLTEYTKTNNQQIPGLTATSWSGYTANFLCLMVKKHHSNLRIDSHSNLARQTHSFALSTHIHTLTKTHTHSNTHLNIPTHTHKHIHTHKRTLFFNNCVCVCVYVCTYMHLCVYVYMYVHPTQEIETFDRQTAYILSAQPLVCSSPQIV